MVPESSGLTINLGLDAPHVCNTFRTHLPINGRCRPQARTQDLETIEESTQILATRKPPHQELLEHSR